MNDKELGLDVFEMADDEEIKRIAADCPASPEEKERMFKLSQKIYNERTNESNEAHADEVSGVEQYKKPIWHKIVSAAAALALVAGLGAGGYMLARNKGADNHFAGGENSQVQEAAESNYPFGSLENERVRMTCSAIAPAVVELTPEKVSELASLLEEESWEETDEPNMADGEYYMLFFYNNGKSYELIIMPHNNIQFDTLVASDGKIYIGGSKIYDFLHTIKFEPDDFLYDMDNDSAEDFVNEVWTFDKKDITIDESSVNDEEKPIPDFTAMNIELAKEQLKERGLNSQVIKVGSTEIQPNYVIRTEPEAGEKLKQGDTVILYVSMGSEGENVTVDDYIGKMAEDASIMAGYKNFKVSTYEIPSREPQGAVVEQYPKAGDKAAAGGIVTLFTSKGGYTAGEITYRFIVPDDINGRYAVDFIWTDGDGITKAESSGNFVLPEYGNVVLTEISGKGNECEATAYLTNLENNKKAELGHYILDFDKGDYTVIDEDIEGAFEAIK
ncbi:PASTA domain-containing protein [Ruminococcus flavefaciens]|uniref:PASTA domain-containing protein n=1 Tax=Ruminococcus flavefaciens TaxID=1265 RepID=UPI0013DCB50D|nr:PASTA domain-containing protein [Ruminococcus flavefaciens]